MLDFSGAFAKLARQLLYLWVRTDVFSDLAKLDPARPVCYVLQDRHYSNMLVLHAETRKAGFPRAHLPLQVAGVRGRRSFFFLNRQRGVPASAASPLLESLVHAVVADASLDVQLVPVLILWGRAPDKQDSILKALFAETWRPPGVLRQFLSVLLHGRHTLVRFNAPLSLHELVHGRGDTPLETLALRKVTRVLRVHFRRQREMAIGPDLSHRNTQVESILASPGVRAAMRLEADGLGFGLAEAQAKARRFALEIASDYSYGVVRALELFLTWLWERIYDGIEVHNLDALARIAPGQGIVYVPCHRSHIDYLLLSFLIHRNGMTPPHIAAGANLNLPLVGSLLRRGGAFFLRRSFKGEPLYAAVFHEYLHLMLARGFPIEYFIEGGRSRTGRTLMPRAGILGMTIRSFVRSHNRPLVFVPVYIGYERVIEGNTYVEELAGRPKRKESLWQLLGAVRHLRRHFGKVHVNFGEPLPLGEFLDRAQPGWRGMDADGEWLRTATREASLMLAARINDTAVLNPVSYVALGLLATPRCTADVQAFVRLVGHYRGLDTENPYSPRRIACDLDPEAMLAQAMRLDLIEEIAHPLGRLVRVPEEQRPLLAYYRNNVIHLFALPALVACLIGGNRSMDTTRLVDAVRGIYALMGAELFLHWTPHELPAQIARILELFAARGLLSRAPQGTRLVAPKANSEAFEDLRLIGETVRPTLARHFLALALLQERGSGTLSRRSLEEDCHLLAQRLALLHGVGAGEAIDRSVFSTMVANLIDTELLREDDDRLLRFDERLVAPLAFVELVLPADARQAIRRITAASSST